ncbi:MAG: aromatic amino acid hydroxylase [Clostridia bacterium]
MSHSATEHSLVHVPAHLRQFVVEQDYDRYTPIDHAVWRYVMRQNSQFLGERAHSAYLEGLRTSGIGIERIPNIAEMNECLSQIGWGAVTIDGFIPAVAFFDFQAHGILPIACDIRQYDHIAYTPAPDIIHEAAGHAPIIKDEKYRTYLKVFGDIGSRALSTRQDYELYEAIRLLSIVKEDPEATAEQIREAEEDLERKVKAVTVVSEATKLSRLYWWTVEYGLIGDVNDPQIYGAGLLSSVGESMSCLRDDVKKIPFSLEACVETDFDITKPQPQLFVCKNFDELIDAVQQFAKTMGQSVGGTKSLQAAKDMGQISTSVYSSGLQVSGTLSRLILDEEGEAVYLNTSGPSALAINNQELPHHGKAAHEHGFGSPIGKLDGVDKPLEAFTDDELRANGIMIGQQATLTFASGIIVRGNTSYLMRHPESGAIVLIGFDACTVTLGEDILFSAEWGTYDMAVGEQIVSVFAGAADRATFVMGTHQPSAVQTKRPSYTSEQLQMQRLFQQVRSIRESNSWSQDSVAALEQIYAELQKSFPQDWLLRLELLELLHSRQANTQLKIQLHEQLLQLARKQPDHTQLIHNGIGLVFETK